MAPLKRPIAALVIAVHLALLLQPLSVLTQEKGQQNVSGQDKGRGLDNGQVFQNHISNKAQFLKIKILL